MTKNRDMNSPRELYFHPMRMEYGAPSGAVGISDRPDNPQDATCFIGIDPHKLALSDAEAEAMAEELCRRWNSFNHGAHEEMTASEGAPPHVVGHDAPCDACKYKAGRSDGNYDMKCMGCSRFYPDLFEPIKA